MNISAHYFIEIRLIILVLHILILLFAGPIKSAVADWPGECVFVLGVDSAYQQFDNLNRYSCEILINYDIGDIYTGNCRVIPKGTEPLWWSAYLSTYYYENGRWNLVDVFQGGAYLTYPVDGTELPGGCTNIPSRKYNLGQSNRCL
jgi:hypothetical protein